MQVRAVARDRYETWCAVGGQVVHRNRWIKARGRSWNSLLPCSARCRVAVCFRRIERQQSSQCDARWRGARRRLGNTVGVRQLRTTVRHYKACKTSLTLCITWNGMQTNNRDFGVAPCGVAACWQPCFGLNWTKCAVVWGCRCPHFETPGVSASRESYVTRAVSSLLVYGKQFSLQHALNDKLSSQSVSRGAIFQQCCGSTDLWEF